MINIVVFALSFTGLFSFLLAKLFRSFPQKRLVLDFFITDKYYRIFPVIQYALLMLAVMITISSFLYEARPDYYFIIEALLFANGVFIALSKGIANRESILILTISVVVALNFVSIVGRNWYVPVNTDEYRDALIANSIVSGSKFSDVQLLMNYFNGYYALIPAVPISLSSLSITTGVAPYLTIPILNLAVSFVSVMGVFLAIRRFGNDILMGWIGAFLVFSTPRMFVYGAIPQHISMAIIAVALLLFFIRLNNSKLVKGDLRYTGIMIFLLIGSIIYHPNGGLTILFLLIPIIILTKIIVARQLSSKFGLLAVICVLTSITYWTYNDLALSTLTLNDQKFFNSFFHAYETKTAVRPNIEQPGNDIYAYSWALPYAISAAFLLVQGLFFIRSRRLGFKGQTSELRNKFLISVGAALVAIPLTLVGFLSFFADPSASVERYVSVSTYYLMLIPASFSASSILHVLKAPYFLIVLIILSISIGIGSNSSEIAPFERKSFESIVPLYTTYLEILPFKRYVPIQSLMYLDTDVPGFWYLELPSLDIYEPQSYGDTRDVLRDFANGTLNYFPNYRGDVTMFMIKTDRLNSTASYKDVNLVQSTGIHKIFVAEKALANKTR
jgi:hypothetical protein